MDDQVGNISMGIDNRNEIDILELKVTIAGLKKKNRYKHLAGDLNRRKNQQM